MDASRRQILQMLAEGKVTADEAERLIASVEQHGPTAAEARTDVSKSRFKYLRVQVDAEDNEKHDGPTKVNVRVPMQLLRAGVKLAGLIPAKALTQANQAMQGKGIPIDLSQIKPDNLEELVEHLNDLTVDVDQRESGAKVRVRVFCE